MDGPHMVPLGTQGITIGRMSTPGVGIPLISSRVQGGICLHRLDRTAESLVDSTIPKRRRSTSYAISRQSNDPASYPRSISNRFSLLLPEQRQNLDRSGDYEDTSRDLSQTLPATPEGTWNQYSPLRNATSMFPMSPSYDSEDAAGTQHIPLPAELESPVQFQFPPGPYLPEPLVLTPQIVVTPEYSALDEGVATLWAAVQLSAQVCRVNGPDQKDHDTAYGQTTGHRREPSTSGG